MCVRSRVGTKFRVQTATTAKDRRDGDGHYGGGDAGNGHSGGDTDGDGVDDHGIDENTETHWHTHSLTHSRDTNLLLSSRGAHTSDEIVQQRV